MKVYFLSGLGADKTVFQFLDHTLYEPVFIDWIPPLKGETLPRYALRLKEAFLPDDALIIGLSFGGMLATEIAKSFPLVRVILISSAKTQVELPPIYRTGKYFAFHHWAPYSIQKWFMLRMKWIFGIKSERVKRIYEQIIRVSDPAFNTWAVDSIIGWKNMDIPRNILHIHGTSDRILPYRYIDCNYAVKGGGHLMVMEQAEVVSDIIKNILTNKMVSFSTLSSSAGPSVHPSRV